LDVIDDDNVILPIFEASASGLFVCFQENSVDLISNASSLPTASTVLKQFYNSRYNFLKEGEKEKEKKRLSIFHRLKKGASMSVGKTET